jgi:hypothetical protein
MNSNYYEIGLRKALHIDTGAKRIRDLGDSSPFFSRLMRRYPTVGSKIDWQSIPGSVERAEHDESLQLKRFISFFDEVVQRFELAGDVIYLGDSATDFALAGSMERMREALPDLFAVPQHHYLITPDASWCICFTMEGDMAFGFAPASTRSH